MRGRIAMIPLCEHDGVAALWGVSNLVKGNQSIRHCMVLYSTTVDGNQGLDSIMGQVTS